MAGLIDSRVEANAIQEFLRKTNLTIHRGPNDGGFNTFDSTGSGMRRLRIIDIANDH
jgi:asparagine synthetase B (glutamine-hydrolysing)